MLGDLSVHCALFPSDIHKTVEEKSVLVSMKQHMLHCIFVHYHMIILGEETVGSVYESSVLY